MTSRLIKHPIFLALLLSLIIGIIGSIIFPADYRILVILIAMFSGLVAIAPVVLAKNPNPDNEELDVIEPEQRGIPSVIKTTFLYNTLHNVSALSLFKPEKASQVIENLGALLRTVSEIEPDRYTILGEEFKVIELYLDIEKSRLTDRLLVELYVSPECFEIAFPALALLPVIENCIHYGIEQSESPIKIILSSLRRENGLQIEIGTNNTSSHKEQLLEEKRNQMLEELQQKLNNFYGTQILVEREKDPEGEIITLHLPS